MTRCLNAGTKPFSPEWPQHAQWFWFEHMDDYNIMTIQPDELQLICHSWRKLLTEQRSPKDLWPIIEPKIEQVQFKLTQLRHHQNNESLKALKNHHLKRSDQLSWFWNSSILKSIKSMFLISPTSNNKPQTQSQSKQQTPTFFKKE